MSKFKLKLINLREENYTEGVFGQITQPPMCQTFLAAMIPKGLDIDVEILDEQIEPINLNMDCDAVVFSPTTHIAKRCYDLVEEFRKRNKTVILGGYHTTMCPEEAQKFADSIIVGEAEDIWPEVVKDLVKGKLKKKYVSTKLADLKKTPSPRRDLLKIDKYVFPNTVIATRGCPYMCNYCASSKIYGPFRRRDTDTVINEIKNFRFKRLRDKFLMFVDDEIFFPKKESIEFFKKLAPLKLKWFSQATMTAIRDKELMKAAAESGCVGLMVGVETLNPENYKEYAKYQNYSKGLNDAVKYVNNLGIFTGALMIFGLDNDTPEAIDKTIETMRKSRFIIASYCVLRAYPGTPQYTNLLKEKRILEDWWMKGGNYRDAANDFVPDYLKVYFDPKHDSPLGLQIKTLESNVKTNTLFSLNKLKNFVSLFWKSNKIFTVLFFFAQIGMEFKFRRMLWKLKKFKKK